MRFDRRSSKLQFICDDQFLEVANPTVPPSRDVPGAPEVEAMLVEIRRVFPEAAERAPRDVPRRWNSVVVGHVDPYFPTSLYAALNLKESEGRKKAVRDAVKAGNPRLRN